MMCACTSVNISFVCEGDNIHGGNAEGAEI